MRADSSSSAIVRERMAQVLPQATIAPASELAGYAVGGVIPKAAVFPSSEEQLSAMLGLAAREGWAVVPRGNGSLMALGNLPERVDVVLGLAKLHSAIQHAPGDLTVTVGAGTTLAELEDKLAREGQWLPLDPPLARQRTLGGTLATGLAGPLSLAFGTARDMVIGMKVASPDGVMTKSGGKVVKNVTGLDMAKVHLGALGTLGVIVEASFRVLPTSRSDVTLAAHFEGLDRALTASRELESASGVPQAVEVIVHGGDGVRQGCAVYARYMGATASMERRLREGAAVLRGGGAVGVEELGGEAATQAWRRLADFGWDAMADDGLLLRLACLPSRVPEMATAVTEVAKQKGHAMTLIAGPGRGVVMCRLSDTATQQTDDASEIVAAARQVAARLSGYAVVERCPVAFKAHLDIWGDPGDGLPLMRRLKEQMDPRRILNPGRFVGGI